jgi:heptosyltransferase-2
MWKILIYAPNWIGDAVMTVPFISQLKQGYPDSEISIICKNWVADVFSTLPEIKDIIQFNREDYKVNYRSKKIAKKLSVETYDLGFLLSDSFSSARLLYKANITRRIGYRGQFRMWMLTDSLSLKKTQYLHRTDKYLQLLTLVSITPSAGKYPQISAPVASRFPENWKDEKIHIGINPNSVAISRRWPREFWIEFIDRLSTPEFQFIFFGGPDDWESNQEIINKSNGNLINFAEKGTLVNSMAIMACCQLIVSNDSGPMHIADALGVPTIGLFGAGDTGSTGLCSKTSLNLDAKAYCSPCKKNICPNKKEPLICLYKITPEMVTEKSREILKNWKI